MKLNKRQRIAAALTAPLFGLAVIVPPWKDIMSDRIVFSPLWINPGKAIIYLPMIFLEWVCIYIVLAVILLSLRTPKPHSDAQPILPS
jgi:hypothetical protein